MNVPQIVQPEDIFISGRDLPLPELRALCLDGILRHYIGNVYVSSGYRDSPEVRIQAAASVLPYKSQTRVTFSWLTALWIYGLIAAPDFIDVTCDPQKRTSKSFKYSRTRFHDVPLKPTDVMYLSHLRVTTPERTAIDFALECNNPSEAAENLYALKPLVNFKLVEEELAHNKRKVAARALRRVQTAHRDYPMPSLPATAKHFYEKYQKPRLLGALPSKHDLSGEGLPFQRQTQKLQNDLRSSLPQQK